MAEEIEKIKEMSKGEFWEKLDEIKGEREPAMPEPYERNIVEEITDNPIPSILTLSFREIVDYYQEQIVMLKAGGGTHRKNKVTLSGAYGMTYKTGGSSVIEIHYEQERDKSGAILNPWNKAKIQEAFDHFDNNLPEYEDKDTGKTYPPDIPIEELVVEIEDDEIADLEGCETNTFDLKLESDKAEKIIWNKVKKRNEDLHVYEQGFNVRNLNSRLLLERQQKYGEPPDQWKPIINWNGPTDIHIQSPIITSGIIRDRHLPPRYALLKTYRIVRGNELELDGVR